ncbi:phage tail sheath subtilisin-like domain-containing protein [Acetobacter senegalensis]|uniref:phage tail sheath subtilisin-like domain-containing protein n=1 Tax=Acetobacter senegalensis TaxID=446692 RepID=UPI0026501EA5|nr:phage tail sheath subtilisin-like domain-containing protein [Acetobacter senegalensis]MDN7351762.1 phage tail sheath C-terminal domain-containing protein [Acetobacter senegalensis]
MTLTVDEVPSGYAVPGSYTQVKAVNSGTTLAGMPLRVLLIGVLGTGNGKALTVYPNITPASATALAGAGSATAQMVKAFATDAPFTVADLIMVAGAQDATAATWTVTPSGPATASGTVALEVAGYRVPITVSSGMTAAQIGAALAAAWTETLTANTGCTVAVADDTGVVTLTAVDKGAWTSDIDVRASTRYGDGVAGVSLTISATAGTGTPDVTPALSAVSNTWYTDMAWIGADQANLSVLTTEANRRFRAMIKLDTHVYVAARATYGQALSLAETQNSRFASILPASAARYSPWEAAGSLCAVASAALNTDPARQLRTLSLTALAGRGPDDADLYDDAMRNVLLNNGMSTFTVDQDGTIRLERVVTTNQADDQGASTTAWRDIMVPKVASRVRYELNTYFTSTYPRAKLADDGSPLAGVAGANVVTPSTLKASCIGQTKLWEQQGWVENTTALSKQVVFERDRTDRNRVNSRIPIQVIGSLIVIANSLELQV